jgi:hypothetical protein
MPVLPEIFARAGALPAMDAENDGGGDALGLDQQGRQGARGRLGAVGEQNRWRG